MKILRNAVLCILLGVSVCPAMPCLAQSKTDANIVGHTIDATNGEHLPFAFVYIKDVGTGVQTDSTGHYIVSNLSAGVHDVVVSIIGYVDYTGKILVENSKTIEYNFALNPDSSQIEEVVVTGNRYETKKRETGQIVNVVSPELFVTTLAVNPAGVLDFQPGSRVEYNCSNCGVPQLRINGLGGEYTQILLDSHPIFSSLSMVYGLEQFPSAMIERVETVRGGGSALFGSNAIAGTVNIITKEPTSSLVNLSNQSGYMGKGAFDIATSLNASVVSDDRMSGIYIFSMVRNRGAYDRDDDGFSDIPAVRGETVGFRAYHKFTADTKLTAEYHYVHEFRRGGDSLNLAPQKALLCEQLEHYINGGSLSLDHSFNANNSINVYSSAQYVNRSSYFGTNCNPDAFGATKDLTVNGGAQYIHSFKRLWFMPSVLTAGADVTWNKLHDTMLGYNRDILQQTLLVGAYAQNEWKTEKLGILLGIRLDHHSLVEKLICSPRVTLRYAPTKNWTFRASYARGYRAPQTYDEDLHVGAVGGEVSLISLSEGLRPEYSNAFTLSVNWWKKTGNWQFDLLAEGFYTELKDVFALVENGHDSQGNLLLLRVNADGARVGGVNMEGRIVRMQKFSFNAGVTFQTSRYTVPFQWSPQIEAQQKMFRSPDVYGYFNLDWISLSWMKASANCTVTGPMLVQHYSGYVAEDCQTMTPVFTDLSLRLSFPFHIGRKLNAEAMLSCKNILDQYQGDLDRGMLKDSGYIYGPAMPRTYYIGLRLML